VRALLGNLEPVALLGMARVLEDGGHEVVGDADQPDAIVEAAGRLQPDTIVLGLDGGTSDLRERVRSAAPAAKVILWSRDETEMQVFDPHSSAPRWIGASAADALLKELARGPSKRKEVIWPQPI
jgi:DNA-binding NarL/FixJ family response regulator